MSSSKGFILAGILGGIASASALAAFLNKEPRRGLQIRPGQPRVVKPPRATPSQPSKLRFQTRIVFASSYNGLSMINPDGSGLSTIPPNFRFGNARVDPAPSPTGAKIAYSEPDARGILEIYTMNMDGSDRKRLTTGGPNVHPAWSPNGKQIAFTHRESNTSGQAGIYVMNANGSGVRRISSPLKAQNPVWTPDGAAIIFIDGQVNLFGNVHIYLRTLTGTGQSILLASDAQRNSRIALSPDGTKMAYRIGLDRIGSRIITGKIPGGGSPTVLTTHGLSENFWEDKNPSWSPDGRTIVFERYRPKGDVLKEHSVIALIDAVQGERAGVKYLTSYQDRSTQAEFCRSPSFAKISLIPSIEGSKDPPVVKPPSVADSGLALFLRQSIN